MISYSTAASQQLRRRAQVRSIAGRTNPLQIPPCSLLSCCPWFSVTQRRVFWQAQAASTGNGSARLHFSPPTDIHTFVAQARLQLGLAPCCHGHPTPAHFSAATRAPPAATTVSVASMGGALPGPIRQAVAADLFLDTLSVNAHTVALDFLWAGVPIVSAAGDAWASRVAASAVLAHGYAFGLARNTQDYFAVARALTRRAAAVAPGSADWAMLRSRTPSSLFATRAKVRELVRAYSLMVELHALRTGPMHICVSVSS